MRSRYIVFLIISIVFTFFSIEIPRGSIHQSEIKNSELRLGWVIPFAYQTTRWLDPPENEVWDVRMHNPQNNAITIHWAQYALSVLILYSAIALGDVGVRRSARWLHQRKNTQPKQQ